MDDESAVRLARGWMLAVVPDGLALVGPETETTIDLDGGAGAGFALASGEAAANRENRERLIDLLSRQGALPAPQDANESPEDDPMPLASAIESARRGESVQGVVVTADEALVLQPGLTPDLQHRALRSFIAGLLPEGRLRGYALLMAGNGTGAVFGDRPDPAAVEQLTGALEPEPSSVSVIELKSGRRWDVDPADLDRIGATEAHRLGPIRISHEPAPLDPADPDGLQICIAQIAMPDLSRRTDPLRRTVQGAGGADQARLIAHAEGAERYCGEQPPDRPLVRSRFRDLPDAVDPALFYASHSSPIDAGESEAERLWAPVTAGDGARRWVPAEAVFASLDSPAPPGVRLPGGSSGLAAHLDAEAATESAFCELVERDAFMWTWIRRLSRERVAPAGIPEPSERLRDLALANGWQTHWVNLSLETFPVILCCLVHPDSGLTLGAACHADPAAALHRATVEATVLALRFDPAGETISADEVRGPRDHLLYHRDPGRTAEHAFLYSSTDEIGLSEIPPGDGDIQQLLDRAGFPPMSVDLTLEVCRPYRVVRALAPGLIPLTFGTGREPDAMARAGTALTTRDGRPVGDRPATGPEPGVPHPFA